MTKQATMTEAELDAVYTHLCKTMTQLGEARASLFLARFALLSMVRIGDAAAVQEMIDAAAADMAAEAAI